MAFVVVAAAFACGKGCGEPAASTQPGGVKPGAVVDPALPGLGPGDKTLAAKLAQALAAKGPGYRPRTRHLNPDGSPKFTNRLILETSPYLLQHAHNPVNWYAWGDEAFDRARRENKPVLLSVGYSTCHWCHVMERESFEDEEIARYLNENYVAIKVDREERPDVDSLYMNAVHVLAGRGGWPMTVVLTSSREPFFAGTYFPARDGDRGARKGFLTILRELKELYGSQPDRVVATARQVTERLQAAAQPARPGDLAGPAAIRRAATSLAESFDPVHGGFGGAPKFPTPSTLELLTRYHRRTKDPQALHMVVHTLEKMAAGGMYDHIGGGFHRYSTDERWLVPHFEKMLYDNAQLVAVYLEGYQLTGREDFTRVARETLDYVEREMSDPAGGFYSATDADSPVPGKSHDEEGWFFTWTPAEIRDVLGDERARHVSAYYGVTDRGNFEGRNILSTPAPLGEVAASLKLSPQVLTDSLQSARAALYEARQKRPPPHRDEKVIASWNGLTVSAFARGAQVLGEPRYADRATKAAEFILRNMKEGAKLHRTWKEGRARHEGTLDDYAFLAQGLLDLYEATHDPRWLTEALALHATLEKEFRDEQSGGFFLTPHKHEALLARDKPDYDGAEPSGNSVAILNLLRIEELTTEARYREAASLSLRAFSRQLQGGAGAAKMLCALDYYLDKPVEVVLVASAPGAAAELEAALHRTFVPNRIFAQAMEGEDLQRQAKVVPLLAEKRVLTGQATVYVCRERYCELPTSDPKVFAAQLMKTEPLFPDSSPGPLPVAKPGKKPDPWEYDPKSNRHWNPDHGHWHDGPPPAGSR
ncbi:MAG: thioredoxin domain-containing protein [Candidatus Rokubacteria bacterium]|nr:thioredoxin domain-containing protein [Candidatus Rokubacteria bacterium]